MNKNSTVQVRSYNYGMKLLFGVCIGAALLGVCIYLDKQKREKINCQKEFRRGRNPSRRGFYGPNMKRIPAKVSKADLKDPEDIQAYFIREFQLGEEALSNADLQNGIEHFYNAVSVCQEPQPLLKLLKQTIPGSIFELLLLKLDGIVYYEESSEE